MKKCIVTVLFDDYDHLTKYPDFEGWDKIMFTDRLYGSKWDERLVKVYLPELQSRYYKWLTHKTLPEYDLVCYMDSNMELKEEPPTEQTFFKHPIRNKLWDEFVRVMQRGICDNRIIREQWNYYQSVGYKDNIELTQNGFFVRYHEHEINKLCNQIYTILERFSHRDQLALPFARFMTGYDMDLKDWIEAYNYINIHPHK